MPSSRRPTTSWPGTNGKLTQSSKYVEAWPSIIDRSDPQIPARPVCTWCQPGPGSSGGSIDVYSSGPTRTAAAGANADATLANPNRPTDRRTCSAFIRVFPVRGSSCSTSGTETLGCAAKPRIGDVHANTWRRSRSTIEGADGEEGAGAAGGLGPVLDQPAALAGDGGQAGLGVDGDREADRLQQRQVARRVGVGDRSRRCEALGRAVVGRIWARVSPVGGTRTISPE